MKKLVLISALLLLTACANEPAGTNATTSTVSNAGINIAPSDTSTVTPSNTSTPTIKPGTADSIASNGAIRLRDPSFCDKVADETEKTKCKTDVADAMAFDQAVSKSDVSLCAKLASTDGQNACKVQVELIIAEQAAVNKKEESLSANEKLSTEIVTSGNYQRCKELADPNFAATCEINILRDLAVKSKDPSICEKATLKETQDRCKVMVQKIDSMNAA